MSKVVAQKLPTLKLWVATNGALTYFGNTEGEIKWRSAYNQKRVFDKLDAIAAGDKDEKEKARLTKEAFQSMTQPVAKLPFEVQLGGEEVKEEAPAETVAAATEEQAVSAPAEKGKFPKRK
jgi:hypothetical protein